MNTQSPNPPATNPEYDEPRTIDQLPAVQSSTNIEVRDGIITAMRVAVARNDAGVLAKIKVLAAAAGDDWYYRWPVKDKKNGGQKWVEGPSIKCATTVARLFGNCEVKCRVVDTPTHWQFLARFIDYETGFLLERPYQQRKSQNVGKGMDSDRATDMVFQIGASKATRNVITNALETFTDFAFAQARNSLVESIGKNLAGSIKKILLTFAEMEIDVLRVERVYGKKRTEWLAPDVARMVAETRAIGDGMGSKEEFYPPTPEELAAHEKAVAGDAPAQADNAAPATNEETDLASALDDLLIGLASLKDAKAVTEFCDENQTLLGAVAKASRELQTKWTDAFTKKMASFRKDPPAKKA